jgi:hypothetical protein
MQIISENHPTSCPAFGTSPPNPAPAETFSANPVEGISIAEHMAEAQIFVQRIVKLFG